MRKIFNWLKTSNRWKHLLGGYGIGLCSDDWYCAIYVGVGVGAAMEYKDRAHGAKWDNIDLALTLVGSVLGFSTRTIVC